MTQPSLHDVDALIAALESARNLWHDKPTQGSVRRIAAHALEAGLLHGPVSDPIDIDSIDRIIDTLRDQRVRAQSTSKVLIIEDDRLTARVMSDALAAPNRTVLIAGNAAEATTLIREQDVSLIVLDLVLPDGDGRDLLATLRATPATRAVPVIVVTGHTDIVTQSECFALGADAVLLKPVQPNVLIAAACTHLAHAAERRLEGRVDGLTGLPNRTAFLDALARAVPLARRNHQSLAVALLDLDHFKTVNDTYGHATGDEVLRVCAQTVAGALRTSDFVARWGGEEICAFLPDTTQGGAVRALDKALAAVRKLEFGTGAARFGVTFSAGVSTNETGASMELLLAEADRLLYVAKSSGRNRVISTKDEADPPRPSALLVEDDPSVAALVSRLLERAGFNVEHFADGADVLTATESRHFIVAIIDIQIPGKDGFQLVSDLRATPATAKMPILFLTASGEEDNVIRGFDVGANDYLVKPFHPGELIARINRLIPQR